MEPSASERATITAHIIVTVFSVGCMTDATVSTTEITEGRCADIRRTGASEASRARKTRAAVVAAVVAARRSGRRGSGRRPIGGVTDVGVMTSVSEETCVTAQIQIVGITEDASKATRVGERAARAASYRTGVASIGRNDV